MSDAFRKRMGRRVREVWVRWAEKQPNPKPSWLLNYDAITPAEQDADDCIGMAIWAECFDKFQSEIAELELTKQRLAAAEARNERMFPIQTQRGAKPHPLQIPWGVAELAYSVYAAEYGRSQTLERLAQRGGFGPSEMDEYVPNWRERCSEIATLTARLAAAEAALQPFAKVAADIDPKLEDYMAHHYDHLVGHYRAAAEAAKGGRE